jgi:hypothetical protein
VGVAVIAVVSSATALTTERTGRLVAKSPAAIITLPKPNPGNSPAVAHTFFYRTSAMFVAKHIQISRQS